MNEYDVVVVGAGPCGSSAAKVAAEKGAKTILLEEHPQIGLPQHCLGRLSGTSSGILEELVKTMDRRVVVSEVKARRIYSPSGRVVEVSLEGSGCQLIERNLFDLELARQAANAGAEIMVNTRVTGILKKAATIEAVITNSRSKPKIHSKVVIAADGIGATIKGIAKWEEMGKPDEPVMAGISWHLTGVKEIECGVIEFHLGAFAGNRGWVHIFPRDNGSCLIDIPSISDFEASRVGHWALSRKIKDCAVLRMTGWSHPLYLGRPVAKKVKPGLILAGSAAGYVGVDSAVVSGQFAGQVAAEAIQEGIFTEQKLSKYEELCRKLDYPRGSYMHKFYYLSEEEIEKRFEEMIEKGQLDVPERLPI